jgi:hypothetical protein
MRTALLAAACAAAVLAAPAAASIVTLPSPVAPLSASPPLAGGAAASAEARRHTVDASATVEVSVGAAGDPFQVVATQRLDVRRVGDYYFTIGAPVVGVSAARGSDSLPGFRSGALVWAGFDAGRRVLAARATLDARATAESLPLRVERRAGRTVLVNATTISAGAYTADAARAPILRYLAGLRAAARTGGVPLGGTTNVTSSIEAVQLTVAAPLAVTGTIGGRRISLVLRDRASVRATGRIDLRVEPVLRVATPPGGLSGRALLAFATRAGLTFARARQYESFLGNPDPSGRSTTTYVYRSGTAPAPPAVAAAPSRRSWTTDLLVAVGLVAALVVGVVVWARS